MKNANFAILTIVLGILMSGMAYADGYTNLSMNTTYFARMAGVMNGDSLFLMVDDWDSNCFMAKYNGTWSQKSCNSWNVPANDMAINGTKLYVHAQELGFPHKHEVFTSSNEGGLWAGTNAKGTFTYEIGSIESYNNKIWACGALGTYGVSPDNATCASYDGVAWTSEKNWSQYVSSGGLKAYNGNLYVIACNDTACSDILKYNGTAWTAISIPMHDGDYYYIGYMEGQGGNLWAGASYQGESGLLPVLLKYDGNTWTEYTSDFSECYEHTYPINLDDRLLVFCENTSSPRYPVMFYFDGANFIKGNDHPSYIIEKTGWVEATVTMNHRVYGPMGVDADYNEIYGKLTSVQAIPAVGITLVDSNGKDLSVIGGAGDATDTYIKIGSTYLGKMNTDYESQGASMDFSSGTFDVDAAEGKSVISITNGAINNKTLYVKLIGSNTTAFYCPSATALLDVIPGCLGSSNFTDTVSLGGLMYFYKDNAGSGGGNAGPLGGGSSGCSGDINDPRCFNVTIGNATLQVYDTNCYDETNGKSTNVTLNAFSTMTVLCNATVYHGEGCQAFNGTIGGNSLEGKFFDSTKDNTTCTANSTKNCIINSSCAAVSTCSVDGMNQTVECQYTMYYNANNTTWAGWMNVTDIHGTMGYNDSTIPVENLNALNVTNTTLNLGTLAPGANTSTHTNGTNIENGGNIKIDLNLNGTSVFTCPTPPDIGIGNLSYDLTSATGYGSGTTLTTLATAKSTFNLDSAAGSSGAPTAPNTYLYWGMGMPMGTVGGQTCSATIRIAAIMDQ